MPTIKKKATVVTTRPPKSPIVPALTGPEGIIKNIAASTVCQRCGEPSSVPLCAACKAQHPVYGRVHSIFHETFDHVTTSGKLVLVGTKVVREARSAQEATMIAKVIRKQRAPMVLSMVKDFKSRQ